MEVNVGTKLRTLGLVTLLSTTVVMCAKNQNADTTTVAGRASLGPISGGTIEVHAVSTDGTEGPVIGSTTTQADGTFSLTIPPQPNPIEVIVKGGKYAEEAGRAEVQLGEQKL